MRTTSCNENSPKSDLLELRLAGATSVDREIAWYPALAQNLGGIIGTAIAVGAIGVLSSLDVLRHRPLATLRAE